MNRLFFLGFLFTVIASVFWGAMGTAVQHLFQIKSGFFALGLVTLRQLSAGMLFVAIGTLIMPRKMWSIFNDRKLLLEILTSGVLVFLAHFCFFQSISYSNAGTAAIFLTLNPMLAGLWLALTRGTKMSSVECICAVLAAAGVALMVTDGDFSGLKFSPMAVVWGLCSAVFATAFSIQPQKPSAKAGVTVVVAWAFLFGGVIASFFCPPWTLNVNWNWVVTADFAFIVVFGTVAAFWLYLTGLKYISPVVSGLVVCLEPLSAIVFSMALLGDVLGLWQAVGVVLVLANICLLALARR